MKSEMGGNGGGGGGGGGDSGRCAEGGAGTTRLLRKMREAWRGRDMARVCGETGTLCLLPLFHSSPPQNALLLRSHPRSLVCISQSYNTRFILYTLQSKGKTLFGALYLFLKTVLLRYNLHNKLYSPLYLFLN